MRPHRLIGGILVAGRYGLDDALVLVIAGSHVALLAGDAMQCDAHLVLQGAQDLLQPRVAGGCSDRAMQRRIARK